MGLAIQIHTHTYTHFFMLARFSTVVAWLQVVTKRENLWLETLQIWPPHLLFRHTVFQTLSFNMFFVNKTLNCNLKVIWLLISCHPYSLLILSLRINVHPTHLNVIRSFYLWVGGSDLLSSEDAGHLNFIPWILT